MWFANLPTKAWIGGGIWDPVLLQSLLTVSPHTGEAAAEWGGLCRNKVSHKEKA